jgi:hypothetical protein
LLGRVHPGYAVERVRDSTLDDAIYPPDDHTYVAALDGVDIVCDRRFAIARPSQLLPHLVRLAAGRRIILHAMHSASDSLALAVWDEGQLTRSLSVSPGRIVEDIGSPFEFEQPYWHGEHPVRSSGEAQPYPLPFHPLELGEVALRAWFGFVLEGYHGSRPGVPG